MAREIPEYEQRQAIKPATQVSDFEGAYSGHSKGYQSLADMGAQMAQNAAIERATIEGVKAGQTPGRTLIPAFTDTDKAFVQAYKQQEYATVARDAESFMAKQYFEASKNPSAEGLFNYEENVKKYAEQLVGMISEENRPKLKRDLASAYESKYYQLASALEDKNYKEIRQGIKLDFDNSIERIQEYSATGEKEKAKDAFQVSLEALRQHHEAGYFNNAEYEQAKKDLELQYMVSDEQGNMQAKIQEGKGADYLQEWGNKPNTPKNEVVKQALLKQFKEYNSLVDTKSHIAMSEGLTMANEGKLTPSTAISLKESMTERDKADFDYKLSKINLNRVNESAGIDYAIENKSNDVALAAVKPATLDRAFEQEVSNREKLSGKAATFEDGVQVANTFQAPIPAFNKQLNAMINSRNPENAIKGALAYAALRETNPRAVDGIDDKTDAKASILKSELARGADAIEAVKYADGQIEGLREQDITNRKQTFKELIQGNSLNKPSVQASNISKWMGFSGDNIPNGLYVDFMNNFEKAYTFNPDWEMALEKAKSDTARSYSETSINGNKQVMWLAPDKALPMGDNEVYLKNLLISKSESLFKKQLEKGSQFGYRYKFEEGTLRAEGNVLYESRQVGSSERQERKALLKKGVITPEMEQKISQTYSVAPGTIRVVQVDSGGNEIKGQLYITSDAKTEMPRPGESPSYGMYFLPDGKFVPKPMYDPENFADVARFSVTKEDIQKANSIKAQRDEAIVNRQKYVNSVNAQITEMREKYGELDYDAP